jgi:hypothetical protein
MKRYYFTVALPKMLYAVDLFLTSPSHRAKGSTGFITKFAQVHQQALISISGAMSTTATDAMEAHANVPAVKILVRRKLAKEAL